MNVLKSFLTVQWQEIRMAAKKIVFDGIIAVVQKHSASFAFTLIAFGLLYSFFYGIFTLPVLEIGFFKDTKPGIFDYLYIISASVMSAMIITLSKHSARKPLAKGTALAGISAGAFAAICPVCLGINFLAFGSIISVPLAFLVPYVFWIQLAGLALLAFGLHLTVKSYGNSCPACAKTVKTETESDLFDTSISPAYTYGFLGLLIIAVFALGYQILPAVANPTAMAATGTDIDVDKITLQVLPENGFTIDAKWGDTISRMVKAGVLDMDKLDNLLTKQYGQSLTEEQKKLLAADYSNEKLTINSKNAVFMMYLLWVLAKHNDNTILLSSPFASSFKNYDIRVGKPGYGDTTLVELTAEQQEVAEYVAMNSYRPCCGQPTAYPDCSHGFSALGLVYLMASQGFAKEQIFDAFVKFNSFWFPSTYVQDALYFKLAENKDWNDVDKELVAGKQFSSISGAYAVKKYLQDAGL